MRSTVRWDLVGPGGINGFIKRKRREEQEEGKKTEEEKEAEGGAADILAFLLCNALCHGMM